MGWLTYHLGLHYQALPYWKSDGIGIPHRKNKEKGKGKEKKPTKTKGLWDADSPLWSASTHQAKRTNQQTNRTRSSLFSWHDQTFHINNRVHYRVLWIFFNVSLAWICVHCRLLHPKYDYQTTLTSAVPIYQTDRNMISKSFD